MVIQGSCAVAGGVITVANMAMAVALGVTGSSTISQALPIMLKGGPANERTGINSCVAAGLSLTLALEASN